MKSVKLTKKEQTLLNAFRTGMDEPNKGWLHEMLPADFSASSVPGVMSSLVKKGVVTTETSESFDFPPGMHWVQVRDGWKATSEEDEERLPTREENVRAWLVRHTDLRLCEEELQSILIVALGGTTTRERAARIIYLLDADKFEHGKADLDWTVESFCKYFQLDGTEASA